MIKSIIRNEPVGTISKRQQLFLKFTYFVFIDIMVLNLLNEFLDKVFIEFFYISILTAILLQTLLQITISIEHRVAEHFKFKPHFKHKVMRAVSTWAILFISKLIILKAISFSFGHSVTFGGPDHTRGLLIFIIVVIVIITTEQLFASVYKRLG